MKPLAKLSETKEAIKPKVGMPKIGMKSVMERKDGKAEEEKKNNAEEEKKGES